MDQKKILVVEDDQLLRELYFETLKDEGYTVETAIDGEEGFNKMIQGNWDLVLLDIILPRENGLEIAKKIKSLDTKLPYKKLVFMTNLDKDEEMKEALSLGDGYLIKSNLTPGDVLEQVKKYLFLDSQPKAVQPQPQGG